MTDTMSPFQFPFSEIVASIEELHRLNQPRRTPEAERAIRRLQNRERVLREGACNEFAALNGWTVTNKSFSPDRIGHRNSGGGNEDL
jgi:hypothetical protein